MTVKEVLAMLYCPEEVNISWNCELVGFNFKSDLDVDAWGDCIVDKIHSVGEARFELALKAIPQRRRATV